jgi:hypothetical protein
MDHLCGLPWYALVTTGRTGSDFLQSLLDGHPEVLVFNGILLFHKKFWRPSLVVQSGVATASDLLDEFVGVFIEKLNSRYDFQERKDQLGENRDSSIKIDTAIFRAHAEAFLDGRSLDAKNVLLAVYGAYHVCLGRDPLLTRIIFHHVHHFDELDLLRTDVPDVSVVVTTRDPRANFVSGVDNHRAFSGQKGESFILYYINRILLDSAPCEERGLRYVAIRLEDLPHPAILQSLADWLGVSFHPCMLQSTWAGLQWYGDRLSPKAIEPSAWHPGRSENGWQQRLGPIEQYVLNFLMQERLRHYGYACRPIQWWDFWLVPLLIFLPMRAEVRILGPIALIKRLSSSGVTRDLASDVWYYALRVKLFFSFYVKTLKGTPFLGSWLHISAAPSPGGSDDCNLGAR